MVRVLIDSGLGIHTVHVLFSVVIFHILRVCRN